MSRSVSCSFLINSRPLLVSQSRTSHQLSTFACQSLAHFSSTLNLCLSVSSSFVSNSRPLLVSQSSFLINSWHLLVSQSSFLINSRHLLVSQSSFLINSRPLLYHAWKRKKEKLTNALASSSAQLLWFTAGAETSPHHAVRKTGSPRKKSLSPLAFVPGACTYCCLQLLVCRHEVSTSPPKEWPWGQMNSLPKSTRCRWAGVWPGFPYSFRQTLNSKRVTDALWGCHFVVLWTGPRFPPLFSRESLNNPHPPRSHRAPPFVGLTVQPCGEPCGSAAWLDFLTVEVYLNRKEIRLFWVLESMQVDSSMFGMFRFRIRWAAAAQEIIQAEHRAFDMSFCWTGEHVEPRAAWFYAEPSRAEKHVQKDKRNRARWGWGGGGYLGSHLFYPLFCLLFSSQYQFFFCVDKFSKIMNIRFKAEQVSICKYVTHYSFSTLTNS
jgi:hypothetical protein